MEKQHRNGCNLNQEIKKILLLDDYGTTIKSRNAVVEVNHKSKVVKDVCGVVGLAAGPHYSLTLDTGTADRPCVLPLTLVDSTRHLAQWISVVGKQVRIYQLLVVCELFQMSGESGKSQDVNILVKLEDIQVLDDNCATSEISPAPDEASSSNTSKHKRGSAAGDVISNLSSCRIMVHHVSMPFYVDQPLAYCLVFISYIDSRRLEVKLWLVLEAEQVAWREFLVPNREYLIQFPLNIDKYFFDKSQVPLDKIFSQPNKELTAIFHHKSLFSTLNGCHLPFGSKIFLTSNSQFSEFVYRFVKDPLSSWYSASEADSARANLVSLYGQVETVIYIEDVAFSHSSCYLCIRARPKEPVLEEPDLNVDYSWMNPWKSQLSLGKDDLLEFPSAKETTSTMKTGVAGKMVQIIKLRDEFVGTEHSVYLKHSYIPNSQQLCKLTPGMVLCITHLNRRCSSVGKYYFIATALTNFRVLSLPSNENHSEGWGLYGLRHLTPGTRDKMWGVLESYNLSKVAITARCTRCQAAFYRGSCTQDCSDPNNYTMSVYAISWLQIIHDTEKVSLDKVIIKDDNVQKLLCIPTDIWQMFLKAALEEEICFINNYIVDVGGPGTAMDLSELLKMYCGIPKSKGKFYVSVKKMSSFSDEERFYYCIHLEPIDKDRLNIVAEVAKKVCC